MLTLRRFGIFLALAMTSTACVYDEPPPGPTPGYLGSIDIDGPDVGNNHFGSADSRNECAVEPSGATRFVFVVASRTVPFGRIRRTEHEQGSVIVSAPGTDPRYEVELPWSHMVFDETTCTKSETHAGAGPQNVKAGIAKIECRDPERGDVLKVDVSYQAC